MCTYIFMDISKYVSKIEQSIFMFILRKTYRFHSVGCQKFAFIVLDNISIFIVMITDIIEFVFFKLMFYPDLKYCDMETLGLLVHSLTF